VSGCACATCTVCHGLHVRAPLSEHAGHPEACATGVRRPAGVDGQRPPVAPPGRPPAGSGPVCKSCRIRAAHGGAGLCPRTLVWRCHTSGPASTPSIHQRPLSVPHGAHWTGTSAPARQRGRQPDPLYSGWTIPASLLSKSVASSIGRCHTRRPIVIPRAPAPIACSTIVHRSSAVPWAGPPRITRRHADLGGPRAEHVGIVGIHHLEDVRAELRGHPAAVGFDRDRVPERDAERTGRSARPSRAARAAPPRR